VASTLVALFGPKRGVRLTVDGPIVVGRSSSATLQLIDGKVSREHCRITVDGAGRPAIEDLGSQNGTFVNGARVDGRAALQSGDELAIGDSLFLVDPDFAVLAARFGESTLLVSGGAGDVEDLAFPKVMGTGADSSRPDGTAAAGFSMVGALASALAASTSVETAVAALLAALDQRLHPARAFVLAGDGAPAARVLGGHGDAPGGQAPPEAAPAVSRGLLASAARRRGAIAVIAPTEERMRDEVRSQLRSAARAVLVAPMMLGEAPAGFLYLDRASAEPWAPPELAFAEAAAAVAALHRLGGAIQAPARASPPAESAPAAPDDPVGGSPAFAQVLKLAGAAARVTSTVLVTGESGTGKEEIARYIHRRSGRGPFVALNCGAIPEALAESELFGHERGAFTGAVTAREGRIEAADGGTLFLDEIGELAPALQVKLLRVLQERVFHRVGSTAPRSVDLRVVAATHRRLEAEVAAGRFREDLFYRLNVLRIEIPPLRARPADVASLAAALLSRIAARLGRRDPGVEPEALELLASARWPGNARELANVLERALVLREPGARGALSGDEIAGALGEPAAGHAPLAGAAPALSRGSAVIADPQLPDKVAALERAEILAALRTARGVKARAAKQLGISRPTLDKKMADLGIDLWSPAGDGGGEP
jgi:transcriptional regulator with GAF, ATPase, and Fis domain